ncbi:LysR family transcriptional regulator [Diaphorobacter sp. NR2-3-3-1]|nr:LysR family transcriptional regulator [Diaphorobacter caeni]
MLDRLQTMQVFLSVVDEGGFTAAAKRMSMTVPHVTRHIAALEERLQTRLLQRTTRRVSLTAAGERYAERARDILEAVDLATTEVQSDTSALSGTLRIVAAPSLTDALVSPLAASFREQYPDITLDVYVDAHPLPDLNRYDLGFLQVPWGSIRTSWRARSRRPTPSCAHHRPTSRVTAHHGFRRIWPGMSACCAALPASTATALVCGAPTSL